MKIWILLLGLILALSACVPHSAPVINKSPARKIPAEHVVRKGETLYSIAWSVGLDYQNIAKWNGIKVPYVILPGQKLSLRPGVAKTTPLNSSNQQTSSVSKSTTRSQDNLKKTKVQPQTQTNTQAQAQPQTQTATQSVAAKNNSASVGSNPKSWQWPAKGKLTGKYSPAKGINGIQISGQSGSAITAAAQGRVVYVGEGLRGYGKLVILKHSHTFLSAYAHNDTILVSEGQEIKSGQKIAKMGSSGTSKTMLHFEIRKDGKPVDPLRYLN